MSTILKFTKLDIALVKPYFKVICFTLLIPILFAMVNRSLVTGISLAMSFMAMTTGYTFSITEKNHMERLYGILPVRKSQLVMGRYVFILLMGMMAMSISIIVHPFVLKAIGVSVEWLDMITVTITGMFLYALYTVFQIPGYYKFGSIKGRVFMYIPVAGFLVTIFLLSDEPTVWVSMSMAVSSSPIFFGLVTIFSIIAMYGLSIFCSIRIMKNKEI